MSLFRSTAASNNGGSDVSVIAAFPDIAVGSVLIISVDVTPIVVITTPGGWTLLGGADSGALRKATYWRVADVTDLGSGSVEFDFDDYASAVATCVALDGADTTAPSGPQYDALTGTSLEIDLPSIGGWDAVDGIALAFAAMDLPNTAYDPDGYASAIVGSIGVLTTNASYLDLAAVTGVEGITETWSGFDADNIGQHVFIKAQIAAVVSTPTPASLTLTGATPTVKAPRRSLPSASSLTLSGSTPTVLAPRVSQPTAGSLVLTGSAPAVQAPRVAQPTAAALTLAGAAPVVVVASNVVSLPTPAALTLAGIVPMISLPITVQPSGAALALSPGTPTVATPTVTQPGAASLSLAGFAPAVLTPTVALPGAASLSLTGAVPSVQTPTVVQPDAANLLLTGATPIIVLPVAVQPTGATLTLSAAVPTILTPVVVVPAAAALNLTAFAPDVVLTDSKFARPTPAALVMSMAIPVVQTTRNFTARMRLSVVSDAPIATIISDAPTLTVISDAPTIERLT